MSDSDLFVAVAHKTGEDSHEIARRGFVLTVPEDAGTGPKMEGLLDVMLVDLPETDTVDCEGLDSCRSEVAHDRLAAAFRSLSLFRHSQGGTGFASAQRPVRAALAACSTCVNSPRLSY